MGFRGFDRCGLWLRLRRPELRQRGQSRRGVPRDRRRREFGKGGVGAQVWRDGFRQSEPAARRQTHSRSPRRTHRRWTRLYV